MAMHTWFECKIRYEKVMENGMQKKVTEPYLVDALSFTEAEARIIEEMTPFISGEFTVSDIKRANYSELFPSDEESADRWFKCKLIFLEILFAVSNRKGVPSWGWYIVGGIIDVILGIYLIAYPMVSMEVIPFIIAFWLMFRGFSSTGYSIDLKRYGTRDWGWYMAFGILAIICSLLILWQPAIGALYAVYMISFTFLIIGLFRVMLSFELKNLHKRK